MIRPTFYLLLALAVHLMPASTIRSLRCEVYRRKEQMLLRDARLTLVCLAKEFLAISNDEMRARRAKRRAA